MSTSTGDAAQEAARFPLIDLAGDPAAMGRQYGEQAGEQVRRAASGAVEAWSRRYGRPADAVRRVLDEYAGYFRRYCPHVLDEMHGLAEGAGIAFEEALFLRSWWDLEHHVPAACTSFAVEPAAAAEGKAIGGQNKDISPDRIESVVIVRMKPSDGRPATLSYAYYGICEGPGINSRCLMRFENSIFVDAWTRGVPHHLPKRVLQECGDIAECVEWFRRFKADGVLGYAGSCTLAEASDRAVSIEVVPGDFRVVESREGLAVHANHLLSPDLQPQERVDKTGWADSFDRQKRLEELLAMRTGKIGLVYAKACLADHQHHPTSICRHEERAASVASLIALPSEGALHVSRGSPCVNPYAVYGL